MNLTISAQTSPRFCTKPQSCGDGSIGIKGEGSLSSKAAKGAKEKKKRHDDRRTKKQTSKVSKFRSVCICIYIYTQNSYVFCFLFFFGWDVWFFFCGGWGILGSKNKYAVNDWRVITIRCKWRISVENTEFEPIFGHVDLLCVELVSWETQGHSKYLNKQRKTWYLEPENIEGSRNKTSCWNITLPGPISCNPLPFRKIQ